MIGDQIKIERAKKGITQGELAKIIGVSPSTIGMYEQNRRQPDPESLVKLADYFKVTTDYLLTRNHETETIETHRDGDKSNAQEEQLPDDFATPEEAIDFLLNKNVIMGYGGFDVDSLSDEDKVQFANELLEHLKLLSYKYKK